MKILKNGGSFWAKLGCVWAFLCLISVGLPLATGAEERSGENKSNEADVSANASEKVKNPAEQDSASLSDRSLADATAGKTEIDESNAKSWISLFDGKTLGAWVNTEYAGTGNVRVVDGTLLLEMGAMATVVRYEDQAHPFPTDLYEIEFEARRVMGGDFFAALTFPVQDSYCTLINGGWGGTVLGLSCVDGMDAANNAFSKFMGFKDDVWYKFRVCVAKDRVLVFVDDQEEINVPKQGRKFSLRIEMETSKPLGFATWISSGQIRNIRYRLLSEEGQ